MVSSSWSDICTAANRAAIHRFVHRLGRTGHAVLRTAGRCTGIAATASRVGRRSRVGSAARAPDDLAGRPCRCASSRFRPPTTARVSSSRARPATRSTSARRGPRSTRRRVRARRRAGRRSDRDAVRGRRRRSPRSEPGRRGDDGELPGRRRPRPLAARPRGARPRPLPRRLSRHRRRLLRHRPRGRVRRPASTRAPTRRRCGSSSPAPAASRSAPTAISSSGRPRRRCASARRSPTSSKARRRVTVPSRYVLHADGTVGFALGRFDRRKALVIDPILSYSRLLGGSGLDEAASVAVDAAGNVYVAGTTSSPGLPRRARLARRHRPVRDQARCARVDGPLLDLHRRLRHRRSAGHDDRRARQRLRRRLDDVDELPDRVAAPGGARRRVRRLPAARLDHRRRPRLLHLLRRQRRRRGERRRRRRAPATCTSRARRDRRTSRCCTAIQAYRRRRSTASSARFLANGTLTYSTYHGGNGVDTLEGIGVDAAGNVNTVGSTTLDQPAGAERGAARRYRRPRRRVPVALRGRPARCSSAPTSAARQRRRPRRRGHCRTAGRSSPAARPRPTSRWPRRSSRPSAASSTPSCWRSRRPAPSRGRPTTAARAASAAARWR